MKRKADDYGKRGEQTRKRILDATFRLIGCEGGLVFRVEEVCAESSISRAAFYHYFSSIDELLAALSLDLSHDFNLSVLAAVERMASFAERADAGTRYYLEKALRDPAWGWAMVHISATGPMFGAETAAAALLTIEQGIGAGEFDLQNAYTGRDLLQGTVLASIKTALRSPGEADEPARISHQILLALGVSAMRAQEITRQPLPPFEE